MAETGCLQELMHWAMCSLENYRHTLSSTIT